MQEAPWFGPFSFDRTGAVLLRDGRPLELGQRAIEVLKVLLAAGGEAVTKDELLTRAWPGVTVAEANLTVQVAALRKVLGTKLDASSEWIVTVPRVGYRLAVAPAAPDEGGAVQAEPPRPAIAVLPFQNLSGDPEQDYFADGIVEDITTALSRFRSFTTVARNSAFVFRGTARDLREVARELGAAYLLEGSVRRDDRRVRITAQLIEAGGGTHVWAERYDGMLDEIFSLQDRITAAIAAEIEPSIRHAEMARQRRRSPSADAYDCYLKGVAAFQRSGMADNAEAARYFEEAIAADPSFCIALSRAAQAYEARVSAGWPALTADDAGRARTLAEAALRHADGDAGVMATAAQVLLAITRDYDRSILIVEEAMRINPLSMGVLNSAVHAQLLGGDLERAIELADTATRLSPHHPGTHARTAGKAHALMALGRHAEAVPVAQKAKALNRNYPFSYWILAAAYAHQGKLDEARAALAEYLTIDPAVTVAAIRAGQHARDPRRIEVVIEGLRLAGMPEG